MDPRPSLSAEEIVRAIIANTAPRRRRDKNDTNETKPPRDKNLPFWMQLRI